MTLTAVTLVMTIFVLNLHNMNSKPVPQWARTFFLVRMAKFMCIYNSLMCEEYNLLNICKELDSNKIQVRWMLEWKALAVVVDRIFFWICLFATIIMTLLLFYPLITSRNN